MLYMMNSQNIFLIWKKLCTVNEEIQFVIVFLIFSMEINFSSRVLGWRLGFLEGGLPWQLSQVTWQVYWSFWAFGAFAYARILLQKNLNELHKEYLKWFQVLLHMQGYYYKKTWMNYIRNTWSGFNGCTSNCWSRIFTG